MSGASHSASVRLYVTDPAQRGRHLQGIEQLQLPDHAYDHAVGGRRFEVQQCAGNQWHASQHDRNRVDKHLGGN